MMCGQRWNGWNIFSCRKYIPNERLLIWHTYYKKGEKSMYYLQEISVWGNNAFDYKKLISGWSGSISIVAGVGGTIGVGRESVTGEFQAGADVNVSGAFGYTFYVGNIKDARSN